MSLASFQSEYLIKPWVRCSQFALTVIYFVTQVCRQIYRPISVIYRLKSQKSSSTNAFYSNAYGDQDGYIGFKHIIVNTINPKWEK